MDQVFGMPTTWALGYAIGRPGALSSQDESTVFGIGGVGGSFAYGDTATGTAFALTKNRLTQDFKAVAGLSQMVTESLSET
jgi:CubicO group peptidase (beta-lactamase class C family)